MNHTHCISQQSPHNPLPLCTPLRFCWLPRGSPVAVESKIQSVLAERAVELGSAFQLFLDFHATQQRLPLTIQKPRATPTCFVWFVESVSGAFSLLLSTTAIRSALQRRPSQRWLWHCVSSLLSGVETMTVSLFTFSSMESNQRMSVAIYADS